MHRSMKYIPRTKNKLSSCYLKGICTFHKEAANSHVHIISILSN